MLRGNFGEELLNNLGEHIGLWHGLMILVSLITCQFKGGGEGVRGLLLMPISFSLAASFNAFCYTTLSDFIWEAN